MIRVQKDVPVPTVRNSRCKYPWATMEVGDSFLFPATMRKGSPYAAAYSASKTKHPRKYRVLKTQEGCRCWRTA